MEKQLKEAIEKMKLAIQNKKEMCLIDGKVYISPSIARISVVTGENIEFFDHLKLSKAVEILKEVLSVKL